MGKKKTGPKDSRKTDSQRRKPFRAARIRKGLVRQVEVLVERNSSDFTEEVNRAVREYLEKNGLWPPKSGA